MNEIDKLLAELAPQYADKTPITGSAWYPDTCGQLKMVGAMDENALKAALFDKLVEQLEIASNWILMYSDKPQGDIQSTLATAARIKASLGE